MPLIILAKNYTVDVCQRTKYAYAIAVTLAMKQRNLEKKENQQFCSLKHHAAIAILCSLSSLLDDFQTSIRIKKTRSNLSFKIYRSLNFNKSSFYKQSKYASEGCFEEFWRLCGNFFRQLQRQLHKMVKHTLTIRLQFAEKLLECV